MCCYSGDGGSGAKMDAFELIKRFGFERNRAFEKIGALSGGERRRLQLLGVLAYIMPYIYTCVCVCVCVCVCNALSLSIYIYI